MPANNKRERQRVYTNTLVFCLIGGVISAMLLLLALYAEGATAQYLPLIITVEVGIIGVVVYALVVIVRHEQKARALATNALDNKIAVKKCPDYWTLEDDAEDSTRNVCVNKYVAPAKVGEDATSTTTYKMQGHRDRVVLGQLDNQTMRNVCGQVRQQRSAWSDLAPVCNAYRL